MEDRIKFQRTITGRDRSWTLPLPHDDPLQPLYNGPPLPVCALEAVGLQADSTGTYKSCDPPTMAMACRTMAAWKLVGNGSKVSMFAARGGPKGSKNPRKSFQAQLADPYAEADADLLPLVDRAMRIVCQALVTGDSALDELGTLLKAGQPGAQSPGVASSLTYVRDRVGVPRDMPLAAARYLRAYLNWAITTLA